MDADACPRGAASETKSRACLSSLTPKAFGADGTDVFFCTIAQHFVLGYFQCPCGTSPLRIPRDLMLARMGFSLDGRVLTRPRSEGP
jgi:hypothetical protein